jgi:hypothetical protein
MTRYCDHCGHALEPGDEDVFWEPSYTAEIVPAGEIEHGRSVLIICPDCEAQR